MTMTTAKKPTGIRYAEFSSAWAGWGNPLSGKEPLDLFTLTMNRIHGYTFCGFLLDGRIKNGPTGMPGNGCCVLPACTGQGNGLRQKTMTKVLGSGTPAMGIAAL